MRTNLVMAGGIFFLVIGLFAFMAALVGYFPRGLVMSTGVFGVTIGSVFPVLVGIILMRMGAKRGRFSKRS